MKRAIRTLLTLAVFATLGTTLYAQATSGRISGAVTDAQGGLLPGATVTVTEVNTNYTRSATTDATGAYVFANLPLGTYTVNAEMQGFKKGVRSGFVLVADGRISAEQFVDLNEKIGGLDIAGSYQAGRTVADRRGLERMYRAAGGGALAPTGPRGR